MTEFKEDSFSEPVMKELAEKAIDNFHTTEVENYKKGEFPAILKKIERGEISREQMMKVMTTRYQVAHFFESMLKRIIQNVKDDQNLDSGAQQAMIHSVQVNLNEEEGKVTGYGATPHREGREDLLIALGVDYKEWEKGLGDYDNLGIIDPAARDLIESLKSIADENSVGALALLYAYEDKISLDGVGDYYKLLKGLEKLYPELAKEDGKYIEGDAFWHVYSHADHDEYHAALAKKGITGGVKSENDLTSLQNGLNKTKECLEKFWSDVGKEI